MAEQGRSVYTQLVGEELPPLTALNNSRLSLYKQCPWLYKLHSMGIQSRRVYIPFAVGSLTHFAIAALYIKGITRVAKRYNKLVAILERRWARNLATNSTPDYMRRMDRQFMVVIGILYGLVKQRIIEEDLDKYEVVQTESQLKAPLLYKVRWEGTPDIVLRDRSSGEYTHFDHKTSGAKDIESYVKNLHTSVELEGDKFLIEQFHKVRLTHGFYNVLQKHYLYERKGEDRAQYFNRILEQYKETKFHFRYRKDYTQESDEHWLKQQGNWIKSIQLAHHENKFPMNDESCTGFYDCSMLDYCSARKDSVFRMLYERKEVKSEDKGGANNKD